MLLMLIAQARAAAGRHACVRTSRTRTRQRQSSERMLAASMRPSRFWPWVSGQVVNYGAVACLRKHEAKHDRHPGGRPVAHAILMLARSRLPSSDSLSAATRDRHRQDRPQAKQDGDLLVKSRRGEGGAQVMKEQGPSRALTEAQPSYPN